MRLDVWRTCSEADRRAYAESIAGELGGAIAGFVGEVLARG